MQTEKLMIKSYIPSIVSMPTPEREYQRCKHDIEFSFGFCLSLGSTVSDLFTIDKLTGEIRVSGDIDREELLDNDEQVILTVMVSITLNSSETTVV